MQCEGVIFDLDGTLVDSLADIGTAMNRVLARHGLAGHALDSYRQFVGDGAEVLVRRTLGEAPEELVRACLGEFRQEYGRCWDRQTRCYPGIPELLDRLSARNIPLAVVSNKPHDFTLRCRDAFLSRWRFAAVLGEDRGRPRKPDPAGALEAARLMQADPRAVWYVGDTITDMQTAVVAAMVPVGVAWGFRPAEELLASGARYLIKVPAELFILLDD